VLRCVDPLPSESDAMRIRRLMVVAALALVATACGGSGPDSSGEGSQDAVVTRNAGESVDAYVQRLYEAAQKEGGCVFYTPAQEKEVEAVRTYWKETFPEIDLQVTAGGTDEILQRALVEAQSGKTQADAILGSTGEMTLMADEGILQNYRPANEEFSDPKLVNKDVPWTTDFYLSFHVAYNTDRVDPSELPTDFEGFTEPRWKGKIAMDLNAVEWVSGLVKHYGEDKATELLKGLADNDVLLIEGSTNRTEQLAAGQFDVMLDGYGHALKRFVDEGSPIAVADAQPEPVTQVLAGTAVFKDAPHPNCARLINEFMLMKPGQQVYADQNKGGARTGGDAVGNPYPEFFGGVEPTPLGPDTNFDQGRQILESVVVRGQ
jgi:iron(III) transport system substrate-binding protein